jgi:hypothetical protein
VIEVINVIVPARSTLPARDAFHPHCSIHRKTARFFVSKRKPAG